MIQVGMPLSEFPVNGFITASSDNGGSIQSLVQASLGDAMTVTQQAESFTSATQASSVADLVQTASSNFKAPMPGMGG